MFVAQNFHELTSKTDLFIFILACAPTSDIPSLRLFLHGAQYTYIKGHHSALFRYLKNIHYFMTQKNILKMYLLQDLE